MKSRSHGFTLMELMVTLALAAVIVGIGVPSYREFSRNSRMISVANDLLGGIQTARTEAIKRQVLTGGVAVCPSADPIAANPTCMGDETRNFDGWIVFVDANNNCTRDNGEDVLRVGTRIDLQNTLVNHVNSHSNGSCMSFAATGFMRTDNGRTAATQTVFCDERGNQQQPGTNLSFVRGVDVTLTGRARVTRDYSELAGWTTKCQ